MPKTIVQIYEIQTPAEARSMIALGVDHIGSVILSPETRRDPVVQATIALVRKLGAVSSLIPLFNDPDAVLDTLAYNKPHIVHLCDALDHENESFLEDALALQAVVRDRFPSIQIMRSIPIPSIVTTDGDAILEMAAMFEPMTDYLLTDTLIVDAGGAAAPEKKEAEQPVDGFVGITGIPCDWRMAAMLVKQSGIPVILAGGISPENVSEGILQVRPFGIDSCTCTNATDENGRAIRFKKDQSRVQRLVERTRQTGSAISSILPSNEKKG